LEDVAWWGMERSGGWVDERVDAWVDEWGGALRSKLGGGGWAGWSCSTPGTRVACHVAGRVCVERSGWVAACLVE
jgi:hypothetical protein